MDPDVAALIAIGILFLFLVVRVPVAIGLLVAGAIGLLLVDGSGTVNAVVGRRPYEVTARYTLIVITYFLAMGILIQIGTVPQDLFRMAERVTRRIPGGLAVATVGACAGFAAVCGSSVATVVSVGRIAIEQMRRHGYSTTVAAGVVGAAGTLGVLIPPSITLVLYGVVSGESVGRMLLAGIIPGIISAVGYAAAITGRAKFRPQDFRHVAAPRDARPEILEDVHGEFTTLPGAPIASMLKIAALFFTVMGGIYAGFLTVVEAAAAGALMALLFTLLEVRRLGSGFLPRLRLSLLEAVSLNSMAFMLVIGAGVFSYFLVSAGLPREFASWAVGLDVAPLALISVLLLMMIPLGMFLDPISMLLISVPIIYPVVIQLGYSGIWFGIIVVKMTEIAIITPPFGLNAFVVAGISEDISVDQAFRGVLWYLPLDVLTIVLLFIFPGLVTWLPSISQ